jgi:hypothetical protein
MLRSASVSELAESTAASSRSESTPEKQDSTLETDKIGEMVQTSSARKLGENDILDDTTTPTDTPTTTQETFTTIAPTPTVVSGMTVMVRPASHHCRSGSIPARVRRPRQAPARQQYTRTQRLILEQLHQPAEETTARLRKICPSEWPYRGRVLLSEPRRNTLA